MNQNFDQRFEAALDCYQRGFFEEARDRLADLLTMIPQHPGALHLLGLVHLDLGRASDAAEVLSLAVTLLRGELPVHISLARALEAAGKLDESISVYEEALRIALSRSPISHTKVQDLTKGRAEQSQPSLYNIRKDLPNPGLFEVYLLLGDALLIAQRFEAASEHYKHAVNMNSTHAEAHHKLGATFLALGRIDEAIWHLKIAVTIDPSASRARNGLAISLARSGRPREAIEHFAQLLEHHPDDLSILNNLGVALANDGKLDEAIAQFERCVVQSSDQEKWGPLTVYDSDQGQRIYTTLDDCISIKAKTHFNLGNVLLEKGSLNDALIHYDLALAITPSFVEAHHRRAQIKTFRKCDSDLMALERLSVDTKLPSSRMCLVHLALGKAFEDTGDYKRAFECFRLGNALRRRELSYDEVETTEYFWRTLNSFDKTLLSRPHAVGECSSIPVFVLGMPRSGSTLIEQILASHPQIHAAGEIDALGSCIETLLYGGPRGKYPECVHALEEAVLKEVGRLYLSRLPAVPKTKIRIVDKMPGNFFHVGLIRLILPNAKIIHTVRNPIDTCLSCYCRYFKHLEYSCDLGELGRYFRRYSELMDFWNSILPPSAMLDVRYEDVIQDIEGQARRIIDHCGLEWNDRCIDFHRTDRPVKTASAVQVRQPLYRSSIEKWRRYEDMLVPLLRALERPSFC